MRETGLQVTAGEGARLDILIYRRVLSRTRAVSFSCRNPKYRAGIDFSRKAPSSGESGELQTTSAVITGGELRCGILELRDNKVRNIAGKDRFEAIIGDLPSHHIEAARQMAEKQGFHRLPSPTPDESAIVALQSAVAKCLEAAPMDAGVWFAAPYFPMTRLNAHVSGDRVGAAYQRSVLRSQERLG
jgi:hypothetical protein